MESVWTTLYNAAKEKLNPRTLSPLMEAGGVAAAILTEQGNIYTCVCIDTACSMGMCAERNAMANMITNGENRIAKVVCVMGNGRVGPPCGVCREFMMQLHPDSASIEILTDYDTRSSITLGELVPQWWGTHLMRGEHRHD